MWRYPPPPVKKPWRMRNELQYRSEWCPCSGASADTVELRVSEDSSPTGGDTIVSIGRSAMNDDTRKLLKIFGVAVTDPEAEAERLVARAGQLFDPQHEGGGRGDPEGWCRSLPGIEHPVAGDHGAGLRHPGPPPGPAGGSSRQVAGRPISTARPLSIPPSPSVTSKPPPGPCQVADGGEGHPR